MTRAGEGRDQRGAARWLAIRQPPAASACAEPPIVGVDVLVTDAEDKIDTVLGFLDKVPG